MKIISAKQAKEKTGISDTTRWRLEKSGSFPKRIKLSVRRCGYVEEEIDAWIERKVIEANAKRLPRKGIEK